MEWFSFWFNAVSIAVQGGLLLFFISKFTEKKLKLRQIVLYLFLSNIIDWAANEFQCSWTVIGAEFLLLYAVSRAALRNSRLVSCVTCILALNLMQFSFGIINALEFILFPFTLERSFSMKLMVSLASLLAFGLCGCIYRIILKFFPLREGRYEPYIILILPSVLFFFAVEFYISYFGYGQVMVSAYIMEVKKYAAHLAVQLLGLGAVYCTLYAYGRTCDGIRAQAAVESLRQETHAQKNYVEEARIRYGKTQAFRHDIKNHLSVLDGLLKKGETKEAQLYLKKLEVVTGELSFPVNTGKPVVDILLRNKLELAAAEGVQVDIAVLFPPKSKADDLDLCIIFANALDNAIQACRQVDQPKTIRMTGEQQGDFYRLEFENTCSAGSGQRMGTGLSNVMEVAKKYGGTILAEKRRGIFILNVLLNIAAEPGNGAGLDGEKQIQL